MFFQCPFKFIKKFTMNFLKNGPSVRRKKSLRNFPTYSDIAIVRASCHPRWRDNRLSENGP